MVSLMDVTVIAPFPHQLNVPMAANVLVLHAILLVPLYLNLLDSQLDVPVPTMGNALLTTVIKQLTCASLLVALPIYKMDVIVNNP